MTATYPATIRNFGTPHVDITEIIYAAVANSVQDEIAAIEAAIGITPAQATSQASSASYDNTGRLFTNLISRLANIEAGIVADVHTQYLKLTGGTLSGAIAMGNNKVTGLATPTVPTDATTKAYVDSSVTTGIATQDPAFVASLLLGGM